MPDLETMTPGQILADTNVATFVESLALGIARAQRELDRNSLATAIELASERPEFSDRSLLALGFSPTFYHFQHADIEVSLQITMRVERSLSVQVGFNTDFSHSSTSGTQATGTATVTVRVGGSTPATATVRLSGPAPGALTVGATRVGVVSGSATAPDVAIVPHSLRRTAFALANRLREPAVPEVLHANVDVVPGGTPITATTDNPHAYNVETPNRIAILARGARPARAWVMVTAGGNVQLIGGDSAAWGATPTPEEAAISAIDDLANYSATLLFQNGRSRLNPRFVHNSAQAYHAVDEEARMTPWIEFLAANPGINATVVGYADQTGGSDYNDVLSRQRAEHVRRHLVQHGIAEERLAILERGFRDPVINAPGTREPENRRVELHLPAERRNVIQIVTAAVGSGTTWGAGRPELSEGAGEVISMENGRDAIQFGSSFVRVNDRHFYAGALPGAPENPHATFTPGPSPESAARALADAILAHAQVDAYAEGRIVHLLPAGSHAILRLESATRSEAANDLALEAEGSLNRESRFSGGRASGDPVNGDTVTLGSTTLTARSQTPVGPNEFSIGPNAAATATDLGRAISELPGFSAAANAERVTVTGPANTALGTSNAAAFVLSASRLAATQPNIPRQEQNTAVAVGLSVDVGYQRRFGLEVTGNSRITARLVSIPAPVELLDEIRAFLPGTPAT
jgi:outer membrane protein OmpA-like peptidoglycan-associated protein